MQNRIAIGLGLAFTAVGLGCTPVAPPDAPTASAPAAVAGSGGCSARGCHGGPAIAETGEPVARWSNAYTFWLRYDKHAAAHRVLHDRPARDIITRLRTGDPGSGWQDAPAEPRCLACHVTPQAATRAEPQVWVEGVGCDACHTLPGRSTADWSGAHQRARSAGWTDADYEQHGMRRLDTPARRAAACVGCHVGAPADAGIPVREVTHDLIAAGHPRLNFEYLTYLALMPPHWAEPTRPPGHPAHAWYAGQIEAAKAGLALCADRATRAARDDDTPWPELAEWNCYGCHHDLNPRDDWRQRRADAVSPRAPGRPGWTGATISDPLLRVLSSEPGLAADYEQLRRVAVGTNRSGADRLAGDMTRLRTRLAECGEKPILDPRDPEAGRKLVDALRLPERHAGGELAHLSWDDAAQTYYALRAVNPPGPGHDEADRLLDRIAARLRLPRNPAVNSPAGYDPAAAARDLADLAATFSRRVDGR